MGVKVNPRLRGRYVGGGEGRVRRWGASRTYRIAALRAQKGQRRRDRLKACLLPARCRLRFAAYAFTSCLCFLARFENLHRLDTIPVTLQNLTPDKSCDL